MRTKNIDEFVGAVSEVYCNHSVRVIGSARSFDGQLDVARSVVQLSYGTPVKVDAGNFADLFLIKHCTRGAASAQQDADAAEWRQGQTMILSSGRNTELQFDHAFQQRSVRLDTSKLEATCARLLGHPLEQPLQFKLRPFSDEMERMWQQTLIYAGSAEAGGVPLSGPAEENDLTNICAPFCYTNTSTAIAKNWPARRRLRCPGLVRRAERYMTENAGSAITGPDVAAALGVSVRSLQLGFRQWRRCNSPMTSSVRHDYASFTQSFAVRARTPT